MQNQAVMYVPRTKEANEIRSQLDLKIGELRPTDHPFLDRFNSYGMSREELRRFSPQWYRTITAHKQAFSGLVYSTQDEQLRGDLLAILFDEYGNGNPKSMHTQLFLRVPYAIGMSLDDIAGTPEIEEVQSFREFTDKVWLDRTNPSRAYGVLYLFENIGADFHTRFLRGFEKSDLPEDALEYSRLHTVAEEEHAQRVINGLGIYNDNVPQILGGVEQGSRALVTLWDGFNRCLLYTSPSPRD